MSKPIIGIVAKYRDGDENKKRVDLRIRSEVKQAIFDNGGVAISILPPNENKVKITNNYHEQFTTGEEHNLYAQINLCDGIILQGGDVSDQYECLIAKYCYDNDIPILGICAGNNNLVRALNGKIGKINNEENIHNIKIHKSDEKYVHSIKIDKKSKFYQIIGKEEIMVNSRHKYSTIDSGKLRSVAYSNDGIVEVNEDKTKKFYIGVQFHPESLYKIDENMNKIFIEFINICKK